MSAVHLNEIDLNLLVVLDVLLEHANLTLAAEHLGRTPSAMSHALKRLRHTFQDELLVRVGHQMELTPLAEKLRGPLHRLLAGTRDLLSMPAQFDALRYAREVRLITTDYGEVAVLPELISALRRRAPLLDVTVTRGYDKTDVLVRDGRVDLALGLYFRPVAGLLRTTLFEERFVCVLSPNHPHVDELCLARYTDSEHALVTPRGLPGGLVDTLLNEQGLTRRVVLKSPNFLSAGYIVSRTDLVVTIPSRVAALLTAHFDLVERPCPLPMPRFSFSMIFSELQREHPGHAWLRELIVELLRDQPG